MCNEILTFSQSPYAFKDMKETSIEYRVSTGDDNAFEYDKSEFLAVSIYFMQQKLKEFEYKPVKIQIIVDGEYNEGTRNYGKITTYDDWLVMLLSTKNIKEEPEYNCYIKSLLSSFCHEVYHIIDFIKSHYDEEKELEECWKEHEKSHSNYIMEIESKYKDKNLLHEELWNLFPWEHEAVLFAFENVSFAKNLYYFKSTLPIWKDFPESYFEK